MLPVESSQCLKAGKIGEGSFNYLFLLLLDSQGRNLEKNKTISMRHTTTLNQQYALL